MEVQYQTYLWFYCIMPIQSIWLCDTDRLSTYYYLTWLSLSEKTINVGLLCHSPRLMCLHSKSRVTWGHLKSWKRIPGSTKHSGKWVTTSNVKPQVMKQLEQFANVSGVRKHKYHIQHVNHRVATCMYEEQQGWIKTDLGVLEPLWSCCPVLSTSLADLVDAGDREEDDQVDHEE